MRPIEVSLEQLEVVKKHRDKMKSLLLSGKYQKVEVRERFEIEVSSCELFITMMEYKFKIWGVKYEKGEMVATVGDV